MPSALFDNRYDAVVSVLAESRQQAGLTQVQLAERLNRPQSYISKVERRERRIDPIEFSVWAIAVGVRPELLLSRVIAKAEL